MNFIGEEVEKRAMQIVLLIVALIFICGIVVIVLTMKENPRIEENNSNQRELEIQKISADLGKYEGSISGAKAKELITKIMENNKNNADYILFVNGKSKQSDLIDERNEVIASVKYDVKISKYYNTGYLKEFSISVSK